MAIGALSLLGVSAKVGQSLLGIASARKRTKAEREAAQLRSLQSSLNTSFASGGIGGTYRAERPVESESRSRSGLMAAGPRSVTPSRGVASGTYGEFSGTRTFGIG